MIRNVFEDFISPGRQEILGTHLLLREIAKAWFRRVVDRGRLCHNPVPTRKQVLFVAVDRGLLQDWTTRWNSAAGAEDVSKVFPTVGVFPFTNQKRDRQEFTLFVRFLVSDVYLGTLHLPEDDVYDELCPICGEDLNRRHILTECKGLAMERCILCSKNLAYRLSNLG